MTIECNRYVLHMTQLEKLLHLTSSPVGASPGTTVTLFPTLTKGNWTRGRPQTQDEPIYSLDGDKQIIPLKTWASSRLYS